MFLFVDSSSPLGKKMWVTKWKCKWNNRTMYLLPRWLCNKSLQCLGLPTPFPVKHTQWTTIIICWYCPRVVVNVFCNSCSQGKKLLVIGTTSQLIFLDSIGFCDTFSVTYHVPTLNTDDVKKVHFLFFNIMVSSLAKSSQYQSWKHSCVDFRVFLAHANVVYGRKTPFSCYQKQSKKGAWIFNLMIKSCLKMWCKFRK